MASPRRRSVAGPGGGTTQSRRDLAEALDVAGGRADGLDPAVRAGRVRDEGRDALVEPERAARRGSRGRRSGSSRRTPQG